MEARGCASSGEAGAAWGLSLFRGCSARGSQCAGGAGLRGLQGSGRTGSGGLREGWMRGRVRLEVLVIVRVQERLNIPHEVLDKELAGTVKGAWATWCKD
eukprot:COSAG02_NODE_48431_length_333_cov_430.431624_1_plen_99_part_01